MCVDNCLIFARDNKTIDEALKGLRAKHDLDELEMERDAHAHLGIEINLKGEQVELLQTGLTDKILKKVGIKDSSNCCLTPAKENFLTADVNGKPFNEEWECASVMGMLMYLVHARPDIQFAVHQCAKFTHNPKQCHANVIKMICRY